ncbi:unnamed protein product, partial [Prorocentrum cordatum]
FCARPPRSPREGEVPLRIREPPPSAGAPGTQQEWRTPARPAAPVEGDVWICAGRPSADPPPPKGGARARGDERARLAAPEEGAVWLGSAWGAPLRRTPPPPGGAAQPARARRHPGKAQPARHPRGSPPCSRTGEAPGPAASRSPPRAGLARRTRSRSEAHGAPEEEEEEEEEEEGATPGRGGRWTRPCPGGGSHRLEKQQRAPHCCSPAASLRGRPALHHRHVRGPQHAPVQHPP